MTDLTLFVGVGLFYEDGPTLRFQGDAVSGELDLSLFLRESVRALAFHKPLPHYPKNLPGFGACHWRGGCPFDHDANPHRLLMFDATGPVSNEGDSWKIGDRIFPNRALPGHQCLVAIVPTRWKPSSEGVNLSGLDQLRAALDQLKVR